MSDFNDFYEAVKKTIGDDPDATPEQKDEALQGLEEALPFIKVIRDKSDDLGLTPEENYILRNLLEHSLATGEPQTAYDFTVIQLASMMFVHEHKQEIMELNDQDNRRAFIGALKRDDLTEIGLDPDAQPVRALLEAEAPTLDAILDVIGFGNAIHLYKKHSRKIYRTRAKAQEAGAYSDIPASLAIPTFAGYQHSISLYQSGGAYLQPLVSTDGLKFKGGKMYFDNMQQVSEVELQNMRTKEGIEDIDLALLRVFYSIILAAFQKTQFKELKDVITLYVPDLAEYLGLQRNLNKQDVSRVISKAQSFHNIVGVLHGTRNGKPTQSLYPVLNFEGYDEKKNTISFSSPYMNYLIRTIYNLAVMKTKDGKPKLKKNGEPIRLVSHSYLVHSSITKQRNKAAVENVNIIVTLIEQAGDNVPRIKATTIIERNPQLQARLATDTNSTQLLRRVFTKTWELLRSETDLLAAYKDIQLPDPHNPAFIPTAKTLESMVFSFPHNGKK